MVETAWVRSAPAVLAARTVSHRLAWLAVFTAAMGILEAICVIYLRRLLPTEVTAQVPALERLRVETIREAATMVMLVGVAWLAGVNGRSRLACFFYAFGIWMCFIMWGCGGWRGGLIPCGTGTACF